MPDNEARAKPAGELVGGHATEKAPPTESAFAQTARPLRLPLKGGVKSKACAQLNIASRGFFNRPIYAAHIPRTGRAAWYVWGGPEEGPPPTKSTPFATPFALNAIARGLLNNPLRRGMRRSILPLPGSWTPRSGSRPGRGNKKSGSAPSRRSCHSGLR